MGLTACASTFRGVQVEPGVIYFQGELRSLVPVPLPRLESVVKQVMTDLDFVAVDVVSDKLKAEGKARMADGTRVKIGLEAEDFESTHIKIRVGTFGDQAISRQIYKHIQKGLKGSP